jgi:hypothetical protein
MSGRRAQTGLLLAYATLGAALMVLIMHPALEAIHLWRTGQASENGLGEIVVQPILAAFSAKMWPMTGLLAGLGVVFGSAFAFLHLKFNRHSATAPVPPEELDALIGEGESERLEFKSSLRWDQSKGKVNKELEAVVAKTLTGLMNHLGGTLLIGVDDSGLILGIEGDLKTLRAPTWDRFEQRLIAVATDYLGGRHCSRIHCQQVALNEQMVAVVRVEPSPEPVYCKRGHAQLYYVRAGNSTRELNTREAVAHIEERKAVP